MLDIQQRPPNCRKGKTMTDKRIEKTVLLIENAFFELYETLPLEKISITKICQKANINRSTFYYHYVDFPAFLSQLETSIQNEYLDIVSQYKYDTDTYQMDKDTLTYLLNNRNKSRFLFRDGHNSPCINTIKKILKEKSKPIWLAESELTPDEFELVFTYFVNGIFALLEYFFKNANLDEETVLRTMDGVVKYGVYNYVYTK